MITTSYGDMSQRIAQHRQNFDLKRTLSTTTQELTTGLVQDKSLRLNGNVALLAGLNNATKMASARKATAQSAAVFFSVQQTILSDLRNEAQFGILDDIARSTSENSADIARGITLMEHRFGTAVAMLNTQIGGRTLFAGTAASGVALADADVILDAIYQEMIAAFPTGSDANSARAFISAWFAPGGQFDTIAYLGGPQLPSKLDLGQGITVSMEITAQEPALRQVLSSFAMGAIMAKGIFEQDRPQQQALLKHASDSLQAAQLGLIDLSARLGIEEERAQSGRARAEAEYTAMSIARVDLLEADPFEAAAKLEQTLTQLDVMYNLTARLSRLTLANYLR
jgi:flagellar hook-associated protein 3 FlgL